MSHPAFTIVVFAAPNSICPIHTALGIALYLISMAINDVRFFLLLCCCCGRDLSPFRKRQHFNHLPPPNPIYFLSLNNGERKGVPLYFAQNRHDPNSNKRLKER